MNRNGVPFYRIAETYYMGNNRWPRIGGIDPERNDGDAREDDNPWPPGPTNRGWDSPPERRRDILSIVLVCLGLLIVAAALVLLAGYLLGRIWNHHLRV